MTAPPAPRLRITIALALLSVYVAPLYLPPAPMPAAPPALDASMLERVFPGVPPWWVMSRLLCLLVGAVLLAAGAPRLLQTPPATVAPTADVHRVGGVLWTAAALAALQALAALWAPTFDRSAQLAFIAAIPLPSLLLLAFHRGPRARPDAVGIALVAVVLVAWAGSWIPVAWRSSWLVNVVDSAGPLDMLARSGDAGFNLLVDMVRPAQSGLYLVFQGGGIFGALGIDPTILHVQRLHFGWLLLCGALAGWAGARLLGRSAAPVATAALLFSPIAMIETMFVGPLFIGELLAALLVLLLLAVAERRSVAALAAVGPVAGLMATFPSMVPIAYPGLAFALWLAMRPPRLPPAAVLVGVLGFAALAVPVLPAMVPSGELRAFYQSGAARWSTLEQTMLGQLDPDLVMPEMTSGGAPGPLDTIVGSMLSPFATPRTPLRLWGDVMFEPVAAALAAVGILAGILRPTPRHLALLLLLGASMLLGPLSSYDRPSLTRLPAAPLPLALLAAVGLQALCRQLPPRRVTLTAAVLCTVGIGLSGWTIMTRVNPTILAQPALAISIDALRDTPAGEATVVLPYAWDPQASPVFLETLPPAPIPWLSLDRPDRLSDEAARPSSPLLTWSPGAEDQGQVGAEICRRWPQARIFSLTDAALQSRAFAAAVGAPEWTPALPRERWTESSCPVSLDTHERRARAAMREGHALLAGGRAGDAIAVLRAAARRSFAHPELFDLLARTLLDHGDQARDRAEAVWWAERAFQSSNGCLDGPVTTLVRAYRAVGRMADASDARRRGRMLRETECQALRPGHPWRRRTDSGAPTP